MELQKITADDLSLYKSIYCDPKMMSHLGGPWPKENMPQKLKRDMEAVEAGTNWVFKLILQGDSDLAVVTVCIWEHIWRGEIIDEIGWMILPPFQGRGLGGRAVRAILDKARSERRWGVVHAFPSTTNAASNAICEKAGFSLIQEVDLEFAGHMLRCNHWRFDLRRARLERGGHG